MAAETGRAAAPADLWPVDYPFSEKGLANTRSEKAMDMRTIYIKIRIEIIGFDALEIFNSE